ncbi:MAG: metallophosphoesterase [Spirochaetales bacterium]|uniref:metallophosphoesterase family protein n=1 Tax=Bullifex sp. TaxID=2815808 RepID=UPI002A50398F|nr:metallophosphoesterase [Bullifex sp.]MDD7270357.1 metallophosphoesterase [Spirochaetales bacterium]MDY4067079.1 metallophosphoesterase [Bullifex sp.]
MRKILLLIICIILLISCDNIVPIANIDPYKNSSINYFSSDLTTIDKDSFTALLISDTHFGKNKAGTYFKTTEFEKYIKDNNIINDIDIVINLGDVSDNSQQEQFNSYKEWIYGLFESKNIPVINVIGNHDNRNGGVNRFLTTVSTTKSTYYCFTLSDIHFYVVDSSFRTLGRQQLNNLMTTLTNDSNSKKIVLTHIPLYGSVTNYYASFADEKERNYLLSNFSKYGVDLLLTGHKHVPESYKAYTDSFSEIVVNGFHGEDLRNGKPSFYICKYDKASSVFNIKCFSCDKDSTEFKLVSEHSYTLK